MSWGNPLKHKMQKVRKEIRKIDKETKAQDGVIDWNYMLNDMIWLWKSISVLLLNIIGM